MLKFYKNDDDANWGLMHVELMHSFATQSN